MFRLAPLASLALAASCVFAQSYTATYTPDDAPDKSEQGQSGTNKCGNGNDQNSMCQNVFVNSLEDFCLFAPPNPGASSDIGDTERIEVAWCVQGGHGTRVIPDGTISGAHFVQTPDYVQVTGVGDFTKINIPKGDEGGELDPHGADGNGNPIGGLVFSSAFGSVTQMHEWTNFMAYDEFCIRACKGPQAAQLCQHIYDVMGCDWNMPGDYSASSFDSCLGDSGEPMGVYGTSTFHQGQPSTPAAHPAPPKSQCHQANTVANGLSISASSVPASTTSSSTTSVPATITSSSSTTTSGTNIVASSNPSSSGGTSADTSSSPSITTGTSPTSSTSTDTHTTAPPAPGTSSGTSSGTAPAVTSTTTNGAASVFTRRLEAALAVAAVIAVLA